MSEVVLDASTLLALLSKEPGHEKVAEAIPAAAISAINLSEVAAALAENAMPEKAMREALEGLAMEVHDFGRETSLSNRDPAPADEVQRALPGRPSVLGVGTTP